MADLVTAVFLDPDAPIQAIKTLTKTVDMPGSGLSVVMDCIKVEATDTGFLRVVPKPDDHGGAHIAVFLHPSHVLFMLQGDMPKKMGF